MSLRLSSNGSLLGGANGLIDGASECCCCKCCYKFCGDESVLNGLVQSGTGGSGVTRYFLDIGGIRLTIKESLTVLLLGDDAENFCGVKFLLQISVFDPVGACLPGFGGGGGGGLGGGDGLEGGEGGGLDPPTQGGGYCDITGELQLVCHCDCETGVYWRLDLNTDGCPECIDTLPTMPIYLGGDCKLGACDEPSCSNCTDPAFDPQINAGKFTIDDPDGSVCRQACPNSCDEEGEV